MPEYLFTCHIFLLLLAISSSLFSLPDSHNIASMRHGEKMKNIKWMDDISSTDDEFTVFNP